MKQLGADLHAGAGVAGTVASYCLAHYNAFAAGVAASATACYMIFKAIREFRKMEKDK
jgi:hypothetical protein